MRPLTKADSERCLSFASYISRADVRRRFGTSVDLSDEALNRRFLLGADGVHAWNLAALTRGDNIILGVATVALCNENECEIGLLVRTDQQRLSIGSLLLEHVVRFAMDAGCRSFTGVIAWEHRGALRLARKAGFTMESLSADGLCFVRRMPE
jgi:GNAT superfamily N-acetyltransferase